MKVNTEPLQAAGTPADSEASFQAGGWVSGDKGTV